MQQIKSILIGWVETNDLARSFIDFLYKLYFQAICDGNVMVKILLSNSEFSQVLSD